MKSPYSDRRISSCLAAFAALVFVIIPGIARAQGDSLGLPPSPPASAIGPAIPLALASQVTPMSSGAASSIASYLEENGMSALPRTVVRAAPDGDGAQALADTAGPIALYVPAHGVTREALAALPAGGLPVGWLFLRYATVYSAGDQVPADRLATVVIPGPWRMTLLPLTVTSDGGHSRLNVLGSDGAVVASQPIEIRNGPNADNAASLSLGPAPVGAAPRAFTLQAAGFSAVFQIGATPEAERMPRPLVGDLNLGETAPDFELKSAKTNSLVRLSDSRGRQPVVLIFGSFT